jgi:hypothetical protein
MGPGLVPYVPIPFINPPTFYWWYSSFGFLVHQGNHAADHGASGHARCHCLYGQPAALRHLCTPGEPPVACCCDNPVHSLGHATDSSAETAQQLASVVHTACLDGALSWCPCVQQGATWSREGQLLAASALRWVPVFSAVQCLQGQSPLQAALVAGDKPRALQEAARMAQVGAVGCGGLLCRWWEL